MNAFSLGLDIGTTSVSAVALNAAGNLLAETTQAHRAARKNLPADQAEQAPEKILATARQAVQAVLAKVPAPAQPVCLGLTGQMHGFLLLNRQNHPVSPLFTWQDQRCLRPQQSSGLSPLQELRQNLPEHSVQQTGSNLQTGYAAATFPALRKNRQLPTAAASMVDVTGFLLTDLTAAGPVIDPSMAASWGIYDLQQQGYYQPVIQAAQIPTNLLPRLVDSGEIVGHVTPAAARNWELPAGLPVCAGLGDNQAAVLGSVADLSRKLLVNVGTGGQLVWSPSTSMAGTAPTTPAIAEQRPYLKLPPLTVAASLIGGNCYHWLVEQTAGWLSSFGVSVPEETIHQTLEQARQHALQQAASQRIPLELHCQPYFHGERSAPHLRGAFQGIRSDNFQLGQLTQAVLVGIVDALCELYDQGQPLTEPLQQVIVSGNFFGHHPWTVQRIFERWQAPVVTPVHAEQAACGAALLAAESTGLLTQPLALLERQYRLLAN